MLLCKSSGDFYNAFLYAFDILAEQSFGDVVLGTKENKLLPIGDKVLEVSLRKFFPVRLDLSIIRRKVDPEKNNLPKSLDFYVSFYIKIPQKRSKLLKQIAFCINLSRPGWKKNPAEHILFSWSL